MRHYRFCLSIFLIEKDIFSEKIRKINKNWAENKFEKH